MKSCKVNTIPVAPPVPVVEDITMTVSVKEFEYLYRLMYNHVAGDGSERHTNTSLLRGMETAIYSHNMDTAPLFLRGSSVLTLRKD